MKLDPVQIRKVITHDNCADGLGSAIIARRAIPDVEVEFCQYGTDKWRNLQPEPGVLFVDFSPPRETAQAWAETGAYVLDHHEHAQDVVAVFGERGLFDNGRCGSLLAYHALGLDDENLLRFATLCDVRDRWQKDSEFWFDAQAQNRAIMGVHRDVWLESGRFPTDAELDYGAMMAETERRNAEAIVAEAMESRTIDGVKVGVCSAGAALSSMVGEVARQKGFDLTACFFLTRDPDTGEKSVVYSMRSSERVDCGAIAKQMGGGGHRRASGFSVELTQDPWEMFLGIADGEISRLRFGH